MLKINIKGRLVQFSRPAVMGILNATPDSFYSASRVRDDVAVAEYVECMLAQGVDIIDVGGYSTRPGCSDVDENEELRRLDSTLSVLRSVAPDIPVSVDTFRASVALRAVSVMGADIINDVSGGSDPDIFAVAAQTHAPYVLTHSLPRDCDAGSLSGGEFMADVLRWLAAKVQTLQLAGVCDIIVDPGFGFGKTLQQNYTLLANLELLKALRLPVLAGLSRKSMIYGLSGTDADHSLCGTVAANTLALCNGADILRVHDVEAAVHAVDIHRTTSDKRLLHTE